MIPAGAKHDGEMSKSPSAERIYTTWFAMLDDESTFAEVARWLKGEGVRFPTRKPGVHADPTAKSVKRYTFNPILKGAGERNNRKSKAESASGKSNISIKADPSDVLRRAVPHLAFFDEAYYDRITEHIRRT